MDIHSIWVRDHRTLLAGKLNGGYALGMCIFTLGVSPRGSFAQTFERGSEWWDGEEGGLIDSAEDRCYSSGL